MSIPVSERDGIGRAGLRCSCRAGLVATRGVGNGVAEVDGSFTAGFGFLKRRGRGAVEIDDASLSSFGVLKRVEEAAMEIDGSVLLDIDVLTVKIEGEVAPRREGNSEVMRRARSNRS